MKNKTEFYSMLDYARNYTQTFNQAPFNEIDGAILSKLSYFHFDVFLKTKKSKCTIEDLYNFAKLDNFLERPAFRKEDIEIIVNLAGNPRYKKVICTNFVDNFDVKKNLQFSAVTFYLPSNEVVIAFRGTDSTLIGWKEDFDMSFKVPVLAQHYSKLYINKLNPTFITNIYTVGHSKGGNLAVYAFLTAKKSIKNKVKKVYSFDGPGLPKYFLDKVNYDLYKNKIYKIIPNQSIIGLIYDTPENCKVCKSEKTLLHQHQIYYWYVINNKFLKLKTTNDKVSKALVSLNEWLKKTEVSQREYFVEIVYSFFEDSGYKTSTQILSNKTKIILEFRKKYKELEDAKKDEISGLISELFEIFKSVMFKGKGEEIEAIEEDE